jgi:mitochondrial fusion and transport protein UGO1
MSLLKRKTGESAEQNHQRRKKTKRQIEYHSSSEESISETAEPQQDLQDATVDVGDSDVQDTASSHSLSELSENQTKEQRRKRDDPTTFAVSISKILNSKLSSSKRIDPVLSRSKEASDAVKDIGDARLEAKAKHKLREEKKAKLENGRVKDILGLNSADVSTEKIMEREKQYKKIAQRGVVRMFNAIRTAQVVGEKAAKEAQASGIVGIDQRRERVNEMSKKGFLDLIASGGKK